MLSTEIYELGKKAYNGNQQARKQWFTKLSGIAKQIGKKYQVCPSLILGKAATQSGWGTDLYEEKNLEPRFKVKLQRKAQKHNNLIGMNAFELNCKYLENLPASAWSKNKTIFYDYGPHIHNGQYVLTPNEPWKEFNSIEDCFEDWAANMRFQATYHKKTWGLQLKDQLIAIESYTPQGSVAATYGMHFVWQDTILKFCQQYELWRYDKEVLMKKIQVTTAALDEHIKKAYQYANKYCHYAPSFGMPPLEDGNADCVGLAFRALYTMGYFTQSSNIDQIIGLCTQAGMIKSIDINDVWKHHGIVCMQDKHNAGTNHVNHVFYSLGGTGKSDISKYDLGSDKRIKTIQPYEHVAVNEWTDKYNFLCFFYPKEEKQKKKGLPKFNTNSWTKGQVKKRVGVYEGPGTAWKKLGTLEVGTLVDYSHKVTNAANHEWRRIKTDKYDGYIYHNAVGGIIKFAAYATQVKKLDKDDFAALRIGPGTDFDKIDELKSGTEVVVRDSVVRNNQKWFYVIAGKKKGYVAACLLGDS